MYQQHYHNNQTYEQYEQVSECTACYQLTTEISERDEELRKEKVENQKNRQEIDNLKREIETLRLENARLKVDNHILKNQILPVQPQPPIQQLVANNNSYDFRNAIPSSSYHQKTTNPPPQLFGSNNNNNNNNGSSLRTSSNNLASKSVLLRESSQPSIVNNAQQQQPLFVQQRNNQQGVEYRLDPFDYNNRDLFKNVQPGFPQSNNIFRAPTNIIEKNQQEQQQHKLRKQKRRTTQPHNNIHHRTTQPHNNYRTATPANHPSTQHDEALARALQDEIDNEALLEDQLRNMGDDEDDGFNLSPPNNHNHNNNNHYGDYIVRQQQQPNNNNNQNNQYNSYEDLSQLKDVKVGLKREIWRKLPLSNSWDRSVGAECSICMSEMTPNEKCLKLPCEHVYHSECIGKWFNENHTCPVCRLDLHEP